MPWLLFGALGLGALYLFGGYGGNAAPRGAARDSTRRVLPAVAGVSMVEVSARWLQERLNAHGAMLVVDGDVGTQTRDALAAWVAANPPREGEVYDATESGGAGSGERVRMTLALERGLAARPAPRSTSSGDPSDVFR